MRTPAVIACGVGPGSRIGAAARLLVTVLALFAGAPAEAACPDASINHSARLIEFETMMMDVSLRCAHFGVPMADHLADMTAAHHTIFENARDRIRSFMTTATVPASAPLPAAAGRTAARTAQPSRRADPLDRYMTMLGNRYGAGSTTPGRCRAFDAIALSLGDKANTDKLLTMVADSLIAVTLLETMAGCPVKR